MPRERHRLTIESTWSYSIDIAKFPLADAAGSLRFLRWTYGDGFRLEIEIDALLRQEQGKQAPRLVLTHEARDGSGAMLSYPVMLTCTRPNYGGRRWWFLCPSSAARCSKLLLPNGGREFWARGAYGLFHESRAETPLDRATRRARKLFGHMGGLERPEGMHRRTHERLRRDWEATTTKAEQLFMASSMADVRGALDLFRDTLHGA